MKFRQICNFLLVSTGVILAGASYSIPSPIYPSQALRRGLSVTHSGIVLGTGFIASFIFTPFTGKLMGRFGAKNVFFAGNLIIGLHNIFFGSLDFIYDGQIYFWLSLFSRIFNALGESLICPSSYPLGGAQFSEKNKGKSFAFLESCYGIGMVFGPVLGGMLDRIGGFTCPFWFVGFGLVLVNVLAFFFFRSEDNKGSKETRSTSWKDVIFCPGVLIFASAAVFCGSAQSWYMASMEPHLLNKFGLDSSETGLILTAFSLTYTILSPVIGGVLDRGFSTMTAVLLGNTIVMLAFLLLGPAPGLSFLDSVPVVVIALVVQGVGSTFTYIATLIGMVEFTKTGNLPQTDQTTGMVSSIWLLAFCLGAFPGSTLGSFTFDHLGFSWSSTISALLMGLSVLIMVGSSSIFLKKDKKTVQI